MKYKATFKTIAPMGEVEERCINVEALSVKGAECKIRNNYYVEGDVLIEVVK